MIVINNGEALAALPAPWSSEASPGARETCPSVFIYARSAVEDRKLMWLEIMELLEFAQSKRWHVSVCFCDSGYGKCGAGARSFEEMKDAISKGACDIILAKDPSRISREIPEYDEFASYAMSYGVELQFPTKKDGNAANSFLEAQIKAVFDEYSRKARRNKPVE